MAKSKVWGVTSRIFLTAEIAEDAEIPDRGQRQGELHFYTKSRILFLRQENRIAFAGRIRRGRAKGKGLSTNNEICIQGDYPLIFVLDPVPKAILSILFKIKIRDWGILTLG